jgi:hypothetical protein
VNSSWKTLLWRAAIAVAILVIILGAFFADQNARGRRDWQKVEQEINARGGSLNWDDYIPHPPPTNENFFAAPMMAEWFERATTTSSPRTGRPLYNSLDNPETSSDAFDAISASNYLAWCTTLEPQFNLVREALKRPAAHIDGDYQKPFSEPLPNYITYRALGQVLSHQARCHLALNQPEKALDDLTLLHDLNLTLVKDGRPILLVSAMIHVALTRQYVNAIADGLDSHTWREPELAVLQDQLAGIHLPPLLVVSFQTERAAACRTIDQYVGELWQSRSQLNSLTDLRWCFLPQGWLDQNKILVADLEEQMIESVNPTNRTVSPAKAKATNVRVDDTFRRTTTRNFIAGRCVPNFAKAASTVARGQTWVDHAQIVCALECYRLRHGQYPPTLAALVPEFISQLPQDIITGKPMIYVHKDEQNFLLYSVGWNEVDDGGVIARKGDGTEDGDVGDWVWHYPEP